MPWFRTATPATPLAPESLGTLLTEVVHPRHFFTGSSTSLEWTYAATETISWELFAGRLLDGPFTRQQRTFESWNVFGIGSEGRSTEPLLSLKLDATAGAIHVVRALNCYAWESYAEGDNVIRSRETKRWIRELVGTVQLERYNTVEEFRDELICLLFQAVVGTSRLPLTSVEAPLPAFSFGELFYGYVEGSACDLRALATRPELNEVERAKLLETLLHVTPTENLASLCDLFGTAPLEVLQTLFNEVSLSPYTDLVDKALAWLDVLQHQNRATPDQAADFFTRMLRLLGRHLTAFDLVTFHHRGANYPDALLLDALLKATFSLARRRPDLFTSHRLRRRGLRQGWILRCRYEGLLVPDLPTSQGENQRVLPEPFQRVPEEQILLPHRRSRQLYSGEPLRDWLQPQDQELLRQCLADLNHPAELRELGMGLFLDRPLGIGRHPLEPDLTPLLSYEAFSRSLAERRLDFLVDTLQALSYAEAQPLRKALADGPGLAGIPIRNINIPSRPGTVSLADARQVADDFIVLRTTPRSAARFWSLFPPEPFKGVVSSDPVLILGSSQETNQPRTKLTFYDADLTPILEAECDPTAGYIRRAGVEYPVAGLHMVFPSPMSWLPKLR